MQKHRRAEPLRRLQDPRWWWTSMVTSGLLCKARLIAPLDDTSASLSE